jgi:murein DD-endopeptidase MepM/ murein hydrolase activator NlpD
VKFFPFLAFILSATTVMSLPYPSLTRLQHGDPLFSQLNDDISASYRALAAGNELPPLLLFLYKPREGDDLFSISARCSLPYDTLATLNRLESPELPPGKSILIPNQPGIFLAIPPEKDLELLSWAQFGVEEALFSEISVNSDEGNIIKFHFYPDRRFNALQRAFFLGILFTLPIERWVLTSRFGMRSDPFTGDHRFHRGIDLAAPYDTPVRPARSGIVTDLGYDPVLGNYLLISHDGGYETLYGHLNSVFVELKNRVNMDMIIGTVGSTGMSTGPHLHFEVRLGGVARDPLNLLPRLSD